MQRCIILAMLIISFESFSQNQVIYSLSHESNSSKVKIEIETGPVETQSAQLVIPRSGPGTYSLTDYSAYVDNVIGFTVSGEMIPGVKGDGSFYTFDGEQKELTKFAYEIDLRRMEEGLLDGGSSAKLRNDYLGFTGYGIFGFIAGQEENPITLNISVLAAWPVFSSLRPSTERKSGTDSYEASDFAALADAQYLMGQDVQIIRVDGTSIPLYVALFAERPAENIQSIGTKAKQALDSLEKYYGYIPMPHYTLCIEYVIPVSDKHVYFFSMEHLNSMTSTLAVTDSLKPELRITSITHHIGHSWIPLRSYGEGYRPFEWQVAPTIETIWLNEGFTWYVAIYSALKMERILNYFTSTLEQAPDFIKEKSLQELSRLGSTQYGEDFRIGRNLFSRGALMAHDLDIFIQKETKGKKSFKDVALGLLKWTETNQRAFRYDEIESIMSEAAGVDLSSIWKKWQEPIKK